MSSYLKLVFATEEGKDYALTVADTKSSFESGLVKESMDSIRAASIVGGGNYTLTGNRAAYLYNVLTRPINIVKD